MRNRFVRKCLSIVCLLATSLFANLVLADWYGGQLQGYSNEKYGDFPPKDIDQLLQQESKNIDKPAEVSQSAVDNNSETSNSHQPDANSAQNPSEQNPQVPNYGYYNQNINPWNNNSGYYGPWNNNRAGFSGPWNNNRSGFSGPFNNNGSGFSGPWNSNGSSFGPWGNRGGWW